MAQAQSATSPMICRMTENIFRETKAENFMDGTKSCGIISNVREPVMTALLPSRNVGRNT